MISCWGNAFTGSNRGDHCEEDYDSNGKGFDLSGNKNKRQKHHYIGAAFTSDNLLAAELTSLSFQEREQVYEELHGVDEADHHLKIETPDFVTAKVQQMQDAVAKQPQQRRREYDRAMFLNPTLKNDRTFFLLFLRAEEYDAMLAAKRICAHFTDKVLLWGEDRVARRITLEDFDDKDLYSLRSGAFRYLESKDRAGRTVLYGRADLMRHDTWISHNRMLWYLLMFCILDDPDNHARGFVIVMDAMQLDREKVAMLVDVNVKGGHIFEHMPFRLRGHHICYDNPYLRTCMAFYDKLISKPHLVRMRFHYGKSFPAGGACLDILDEFHLPRNHNKGSRFEARYTLMTFGIVLDLMHLTDNPKEQEQIMDRFLEKHRATEARLKRELDDMVLETGRIPYPSPKDILVGNSRQYHGYPGSLDMNRHLEDMAERYARTEDRLEKTVIALSLVKTLQEEGRGFLQRMDDHWVVVDDQVAGRKVGQALRNWRRKGDDGGGGRDWNRDPR